MSFLKNKINKLLSNLKFKDKAKVHLNNRMIKNLHHLNGSNMVREPKSMKTKAHTLANGSMVREKDKAL